MSHPLSLRLFVSVSLSLCFLRQGAGFESPPPPTPATSMDVGGGSTRRRTHHLMQERDARTAPYRRACPSRALSVVLMCASRGLMHPRATTGGPCSLVAGGQVSPHTHGLGLQVPAPAAQAPDDASASPSLQRRLRRRGDPQRQRCRLTASPREQTPAAAYPVPSRKVRYQVRRSAAAAMCWTRLSL